MEENRYRVQPNRDKPEKNLLTTKGTKYTKLKVNSRHGPLALLRDLRLRPAGTSVYASAGRVLRGKFFYHFEKHLVSQLLKAFLFFPRSYRLQTLFKAPDFNEKQKAQ